MSAKGSETIQAVFERLKTMEKRAEVADQFKGMHPPVQDPEMIRMRHRALLEQNELMAGAAAANMVGMRQTATMKALVSYSALKNLKITSYAQLTMNVQAIGTYLLVRSLELPRSIVCISTPVEDPAGAVFDLAMYNLVSPRLPTKPEDAIPVGSFIIVKEPFVKLSNNGQIIVRVDSPTDIVIVGRDSEYYDTAMKLKWKHRPSGKPILSDFRGKTAEEWKLRGNELFCCKKFSDAREAYAVGLTKGIERQETQLTKTLHLNLAAVYLAMQYFEKAIEECEEVLKVDEWNEKALFRAGRAHYELRQFEKAHQYFFKHPEVECQPEIKKEKIRCEARLLEAKNGADIYKLFLSSELKKNTLLDVADYIGPMKITEIAGKGRGVIATRNIEPGTLLLVCKAVAVAFPTGEEMLTMQFYVGRNEIDHGGNINLVSDIAQLVMKNPKTFGNAVHDLTSNDAAMDRRKQFCDGNEENEPICDVERLRAIASVNAFAVGDKENKSSGLFVAASYFNHSCVSNADRRLYNDILVVHSAKRIATGEEITLAYSDPMGTYSERMIVFDKRRFLCKCPLCEMDRAEPESVRLNREKLVSEERELVKKYTFGNVFMPDKTLKNLEKVTVLIEKTYERTGRMKYRTALFEPYRLQMTYGFQNRDYDRAWKFLAKSLECVGINAQHLLDCADSGSLDIFDANSIFFCDFRVCLITGALLIDHRNVSDPNATCRKMVKVILLVERVLAGANIQIVKRSYPEIPAHLFPSSKNRHEAA